MKPEPKVVIGAPIYNHAPQLREAIESLLAQQYEDFVLLLVDDASTDDTPTIAAEYAALDPRVHYVRNEQRLGYTQNARRCFDLARERFPGAAYFAWGSDHDAWHPRWLGRMVGELDGDPETVLVYPLNYRISAENEIIRDRSFRFETANVGSAHARFRSALWGASAGNMTMGIYRTEALKAAGSLRPVLAPDRLLMMELALYGRFRQVPEALWYRRYVGLASRERQIAASFPHQRPWYLHLPWVLQHTASLFRNFVLRRSPHPRIGRMGGLGLALLQLEEETRRLLLRLVRRAWKHAHGWLRRAVRPSRARPTPDRGASTE